MTGSTNPNPTSPFASDEPREERERSEANPTTPFASDELCEERERSEANSGDRFDNPTPGRSRTQTDSR